MLPALRINTRLPHCFHECLQLCFNINGPAGAHYSMITVPRSLNESNMATTLRFLTQMLHNDAPMVWLCCQFWWLHCFQGCFATDSSTAGTLPGKGHTDSWWHKMLTALGNTSPWTPHASRTVQLQSLLNERSTAHFTDCYEAHCVCRALRCGDEECHRKSVMRKHEEINNAAF